jgi:hypothetical protein
VALESRYGGFEFEGFAALLALHSDLVGAPDHFGEPVYTDPEHDKFFACALAAGAGIIVSADRQLLDVTGWRGIEVLRRGRSWRSTSLTFRPGAANEALKLTRHYAPPSLAPRDQHRTYTAF